jgi:hypothetical protein
VLIARDNARRARPNALARTELQRAGVLGDSVHVAGHEFAVGDRVIARRNDRLRAVDNGMRGTVIAIDPTEQELLVRTDAGADRTLDAPYVAEHLEHAYALTAHTIQGATVDWAGVVGHPDDFTRNWAYTALSGARDGTEIFLIDTPTEHQLDRAEIAPHHPRELADQRSPLERLQAAMRRRDDEDLALDRIDPLSQIARADAAMPPTTDRADAADDPLRRTVDELRAELSELREHLARYPSTLADQLRTARDARDEPQRIIDEASARIAQVERPTRGRLRRRPSDPAALAFERQRLTAAQHQIARDSEREQQLAAHAPDPATQQPSTRPYASVPPRSKQSSRSSANSTCAPRSTTARPTSLRRSDHSPSNHAHDAPGNSPRTASRPTASTSPSPTRTALSAHGPPAARQSHTGCEHNKTSRAQRELGHQVARRLGHEL